MDIFYAYRFFTRIYLQANVFGVTAERRKKLRGGQSPLQDEAPNDGGDGDDNEDYIDEGMRVIDGEALSRINQIIAEHTVELEMAQVVPGNSKVSFFIVEITFNN